MSTLYEALATRVDDWRQQHYPHDTYSAIGEILEWAANPEVSSFRLCPPQFRALETYWYLRLIENTPHIFDLCRKLFSKRADLLHALGISQAAFFDRARILYNNALNDPAIAAELVTVGYPQTRLTAELTDLQSLEDADTKQEIEKAEAKGSAAAQKAALTELKAWVSRFTGIVVPALKDRPDLLAKMGLKPRGGKR